MWSETDESHLKSLLHKKFLYEIIELQPITPPDVINKELNRLIRPGISPELNYTGAYRLGLKLISDFHVKIEFRPHLIRAFVEEGPIKAEGRGEFKGHEQKNRALNHAVCEAVMFALQQLESLEVPNGRS